MAKNATKEMITSGFDLSLYTCTPGGSNRVTVRCNAAENSGENLLNNEVKVYRKAVQ